jgi:hypothetical protein
LASRTLTWVSASSVVVSIEFRVGLKLRIVFRHDADTLFLLLIGTHDEVRRFIRSL